MTIKKSDVAEGIWTLICSAYGQTATTKVTVPVDEVMEILLSVGANVVAGVESAKERERILRNMQPQMDSLINRIRQRSNLHVHYRPKPGILLPH